MDTQLLDRYRLDRSPQAAARLMQAYSPLVRSVCRRYLRDAHDVDDASQETFLKMIGRADAIHGDVGGWLAATAGSTSIDMIRRSHGEQRRRENLRWNSNSVAEHQCTHENIHRCLHEAMLQLDDKSRQLIIDRFIRKQSLRVMAGAQHASIATLSRRVVRAVGDLAAVLRDMGVDSADELTVAEHFGDPSNLVVWDLPDPEGLRFAPDWRSAGVDLAARGRLAALPPGWSRPIRVGAMVSYATSIHRSRTVDHSPMDTQVCSLSYLPAEGFELVGVVEPGTSGRGFVERMLRQYDLTAGLIDASDHESLETLDVILLGINFAITRPIVHAINQAVRSGVGLLKERWVGWDRGPTHTANWSDPEARELLLAASPVYNFHTPSCGLVVPATVQEEHPVLGNVPKGTKMLMSACQPVYRPLPGTRVLITKELLVPPEQHGIPGVGPIAPPAYLAGQLGRGRVVVIQTHQQGRVWHRDRGLASYMTNLLTWLAEPHRQANRPAES